jgi:hypothetical protein
MSYIEIILPIERLNHLESESDLNELGLTVSFIHKFFKKYLGELIRGQGVTSTTYGARILLSH